MEALGNWAEGFSRQGHRKAQLGEGLAKQLMDVSKGNAWLISKEQSLSLCEWVWPRETRSLVERSQTAHSRGNLGSLQLEVRLRDETVLPSTCYQPLLQLLCQEVKLGTQVRRP